MEMTGREKAVEALERAVARSEGEDSLICSISLRNAKSILGVLKELEPRLLSLDELSETAVVYLENRAYGFVEPALSSGSYSDGTVGLITLDAEGLFYLSEADYGIEWRCWTSEPTGEQMEGTTWQDKL